MFLVKAVGATIVPTAFFSRWCMSNIIDFPNRNTDDVGDNPLDRNYKFFPHPLLLLAAKMAEERNYNRQFSTNFVELLKASDSDFNYPILMTIPHEHAAGVKVDPHLRCQITGPWGEEGALEEVWLDVDLDLYSALPDTGIFDDETGHIPQA
jgi:hypothetical protein